MSDTHHASNQYMKIWAILMAIFALSLATGVMPLGRSGLMVVLFGAAIIKAWLVIRNFMHLKDVTPWLYAIVATPLFLAFFMILAFVPDIALYVWRGPLDAPPPSAGAHH